MHCLILGNHTQGLGILRSLSGTGAEVHMVNDQQIALARFSRYLTRYHFLKRNTLKAIYRPENAERLLVFIHQLIPKGGRWPVFCVNEDLVYFLHQNRDAFEDRLGIPSNPILSIIDKYQFAKEMKKLGINTPKTYLLSSFDQDLLKKGPYLCKGRIGNRFRNVTSLKGMQVHDHSDLESIRLAIRSDHVADDILVQEKLQCNDKVLSSCGSSVKGELICHFQYVKLRQHPDEFGTGTFLKSIRNPDILEQTLKIISHFSYTGIFEIEFIKDEGDQYVVIEMNPRTWKSIHFATLCGQNMCATYVDYISRGITPDKNFDYAIDKTWVDLGTDIPMLIKNRQWVHPGYDKNTFFCVLDQKDPLPFLMEIFMAPFISLGI
ncbi:hypothetical protein KAR91_37490 [Candidatus Pacearchaeota archaeon]|nr:hypothetical protein [Candidatus Pacearchaeota archaeon]